MNVDVQDVLRDAQSGLAAIRQQLDGVSITPLRNLDTAPSPLTSPTGLPSLLPFPSPKPHPLLAVKALVQQTESSLQFQATTLLAQHQHEQQQRQHHNQQLTRISSPPPINPNIGLSSTTPHPQLSADLYPLSFSLPQPPPPVPAPHQPFLHRLTQYRHEYYVATPEQQASREYLVRRFGLQGDGEVAGWQKRRPIEVYGRVGNGRLRKGNKARGGVSQPVHEGSMQVTSLSSLHPHLHATTTANRHASYPPPPFSKHQQHMSSTQPVSFGHLPSNADLASLVNVTSAGVVQRSKREDEARGKEENVSMFDWQRSTNEESKEAFSDPQQNFAPATASADMPVAAAIQSSSSASFPASQPTLHTRKPSSATVRFALRSEEEQKMQESPAVPSTASSRHSHHRSTTASAFIPLHDSFGFTPQPPTSASTTASIPSTAGSVSDGLPVRSYDQLLDGFSYHPFFVHHGHVVSDTAEFASFHRTHKRHWTAITALLSQLQQWAKKEQSKPLLTLYGSAIVALVEKDVTQLTDDECLACLAPADLSDLKQKREEAAKNEEASQEKAAATLIQSTVRMHAEKKRYAQLKRRHDAARIIQNKWRRYRALINTRTYVRGKWQQKVEQWKLIQQQWVASYSSFTQRQRVHVHIPSLTLPHYQRAGLFPHLSLYENQHLPRLCELSNPLISIVYLSASALPAEVQTYYIKLLEVGGVKDIHNRLHFLSPELSTFFSSLSHPFPLSSLALYSARLLSSLRVVLRSRPAVIVPADAGFSDWMLAVELGLPLYSVDVEKKARLDGCGGLIRLVSQWNERIRADREQQLQPQLQQPPTTANPQPARPQSTEPKRDVVDKDEIALSVCCRDVYDEDDMYGRLVELMCRHRTVEVWVLRMDNDREGRGVAYVEVKSLKGMIEALADDDLTSREERVEAILEDQLMDHLVLLCPALFPSLSAFFALYYQHGGLILPYPALPNASSPLTSPSVSMLIEPNGQLTMLSSHDHSLPRPFTPLLSSFPSTHPSSALHTLAASIGKVCWKEGVIGYVSVDFLLLPAQLTCLPPVVSIAPQAAPTGTGVLVPVSLHLHSTAVSSSFTLFHFLMSGRYLWRSRPYAVYKALRAGVKEQREEEVKQKRAENKKKFHRASTSSFESLIHGHPAPHETASPVPASTFASRLMSKQLVSNLAAQEEDRHYCVLSLLHLRVLAELPLGSFFALCRLRQLSFDVSERRGLCFLLYGGMGAGRVGMLGVGGARWEGCKRLEEVLKLMDEESSSKAASVYEEPSEGHVLMDVLRTIRTVGQSMKEGVDVASSTTRFPPVLGARQGSSGMLRGHRSDSQASQLSEEKQ